MVPRNVCALVRQPKYDQPSVQVLSEEQVRALFSAAKGSEVYALLVLAISSGMRQGEMLALQWDNIDFARRTVSVRYTLSRTLTRAECKTRASRRQIELPNVALAALRERPRISQWVFPGEDRKPMHKDVAVRQFRKLLAAANLPHFRFHDLRHTAATLMLAHGVNPKVVQERLGHANIRITLDTYAHVVPSMQREAADRIDDVLRAHLA